MFTRQALRWLPVAALLLVGVALGWWITGSERTITELAKALQWTGIGAMVIGGMIVSGAMVDAHNDGGIVDLNEDAVGARMSRAGQGKHIVIGLVVAGGAVLGIGLVLGSGWVA